MERDNTPLVVAVFLALALVGWAWTLRHRDPPPVAPAQAVITGASVVSCPGHQDMTLDECSKVMAEERK